MACMVCAQKSFEESLNVEQYVSATWEEGTHRVPVRTQNNAHEGATKSSFL